MAGHIKAIAMLLERKSGRLPTGECVAMIGRCVVCKRWFRRNRSKTLCDPHYWRVRRLQAKTLGEIQSLLNEMEITRACVQAALHEDMGNDAAVAPAQLGEDVLSD